MIRNSPPNLKGFRPLKMNKRNPYKNRPLIKQYITMLLSQEDYQTKLTRITNLNCTRSTKLHLLRSLTEELRYRASLSAASYPEQDNKSKTITTEDASNFDGLPDLAQQIGEVEKRIILKRDVKIELNQEIDDAEEELEAIEKTVFLKRQLDDQLRHKIDMKMFQIEVSTYQDKKKQEVKPKTNKTFSMFSRKVLDFFN